MNRRHVMLGLALALTGCASAKVNDYRLAAIPGPVQQSGALTLGVRSVGLPGYLDETGIVKTSGAYQFDTYDNEVWAQPLADMLQAVMVEDLAQILPSATVLASGGVIDAPAQLLVEINVQKFDPDPDGSMVLLAQIALKSGATHNLLRTATIRLSAPSGIGVLGTVAAMSQLWAQAAGQIAGLVAQTPPD
jgi:uncharacterized lipoprotein YmbA